MTRQVLLAAVVVLAIGAGALGYALYEEKKQPEGVEISIGSKGLQIKEK